MKKILFTFLLLLIAQVSYAKEIPVVMLTHVPQTGALLQQFYVDVVVDPKGGSINGIQGAVTFSPDMLTFVRAETGTSNITLWIDQPKAQGDTISFSGVIPNGFNGLINPFDQSVKLPGQIVRLVFSGKAPGIAKISTTNISITDNDGIGTIEKMTDTNNTVTVSDTAAPSLYINNDIISPTLSATVINDHNLYDGKSVLIFNATDKESGVDHVTLQEGDGELSTIESPYVLHDQSRKSILLLHAYDMSGNVATITIAPLVPHTSATAMVIVLFITLIIFYVIYKKIRYVKN
ncbi:MAG: hypothetical protein ABIO57_00285 [Candidatus Paceibacterota bacterium]